MPGKIKIPGTVFLDGNELEDALIYIHVKGYSRARVTHIDIESRALKSVIRPRHSSYPEVNWSLSTSIDVNGHEIVIVSERLAEIIHLNGNLYVGGKGKGIFLGFHREQISEMEKFASKIGIKPKKLNLK
ncbi:hypothetical protein [Picrophilus oshimae]|uniref:Hypothetical transferase n=1 Tax=Picrophilus torridus (strain ATCC 700027 / DSM 9790 / JCM 10055 / NBRC 100828 / KAW 2/3) TaxID=1122961 RepID=Q6L118_PICTO|nr:hypothetical protein [Picrophilus oshimae]AAT43334.1 hypothetical transferase [Picrophilus oshimae DSM 9789]SMD30358.1 hypothetical protein SAMN02745355_0237 [Picrophilus oshimae DSM 9789]